MAYCFRNRRVAHSNLALGSRNWKCPHRQEQSCGAVSCAGSFRINWLSAAQENGIVSSPGERIKFPRATGISDQVHATKRQGNSRKKVIRQRAELLLRVHLESNPEALCLVRAILLRATEMLHFHALDSRAIVRSVDEALANVIRHAYKGQGGLPIGVTCRRIWGGTNATKPRGLEIVLEDSGVAADPKKFQGRSLEQVRPGGLGLHFMKESMDVVEFSRKNGKNLLRMVKYLAPSKPEGE